MQNTRVLLSEEERDLFQVLVYEGEEIQPWPLKRVLIAYDALIAAAPGWEEVK